MSAIAKYIKLLPREHREEPDTWIVGAELRLSQRAAISKAEVRRHAPLDIFAETEEHAVRNLCQVIYGEARKAVLDARREAATKCVVTAGVEHLIAAFDKILAALPETVEVERD
jgi:hypothetical protein